VPAWRVLRRALAAAVACAAAAPLAFASPVKGLDRRGLTLTFEDQFNAFSWDDPRPGGAKGTWRTWYRNGPDPFSIDNRTLPGNKEMQVFTDPAFAEAVLGAQSSYRAIAAERGHLLVRATAAPAALRPHIWNRSYLSGMITTWGSFQQTYGVFEMRARLPAGRGIWPAFWMMPADGRWPPEIDVFEFLGHDPRTLYAGYMTTSARKGHLAGDHVTSPVSGLTAGLHTYSVDWRPDTIAYYVDDVQIARWPTPKDMHKPMFMIISLAVGGKWGGPPDATTKFPATLDIDWVRAYRRVGRP
jgi:hypothetical protein